MEQGIQARDKVLEALLEASDVPVPESLVEAEVHSHLESEDRLEDHEHGAEVGESARKGLQTQFLLDAIVEQEKVSVAQPELIEYLVMNAAQYGMEPDEFAKAVEEAGQVPAMVGEVARRKALALVLEKATVTDASGRPVDLEALRRQPRQPRAAGASRSCEQDPPGRRGRTRPTTSPSPRRTAVGEPRHAGGEHGPKRGRPGSGAALGSPKDQAPTRHQQLDVGDSVTQDIQMADGPGALASTTTSTSGCSRSGSSSSAPRSATRTPTRSARSCCCSSAEDPETDIYLYINSPGGSVDAGMAIYDTMQYIPNDVATVGMGLAASMGQFLLCAGAKGKRYAAAARADHDAPALRRHRRHGLATSRSRPSRSLHIKKAAGRADRRAHRPDRRADRARTPTATAGSPPSRPWSTASSTTWSRRRPGRRRRRHERLSAPAHETST